MFKEAQLVDLRYYVVSIVAVFLSLTLGIVLGTVIVDKGVLIEQQNRLVKSIERDLNNLRSTNSELQERVKNLEEFEKEVVPWALEKRLNNQRVGVVVMEKEKIEFTKDIIEILQQAGARATLVQINWPASLSLSEEKFLRQFINFPENVDLTDEVWQEEAVKLVLDNLTQLPNRNFLKKAEEQNFLKVSDSTLLPLQSMVFVGNGKVDVLELFAEKLKNRPLRVVGAHVSSGKPSEGLLLFQSLGFPTVNNVDTLEGQVAVALLLSGGEGNFGENSPRFLPELGER